MGSLDRLKLNTEWEKLLDEMSSFKDIIKESEVSSQKLVNFNQKIYQFHTKIEILKAKTNELFLS